MSDSNTVVLRLAFDDADREGLVFFGNYFRLAHRALEEWLPRHGITWAEWFAHPDYGVPLKHTDADYFRPLKPGEECRIQVSLTEIGESSVQFTFRFQDHQGQDVAMVKTVHVFIERNPVRKTRIPESLRPRLAELKQ